MDRQAAWDLLCEFTKGEGLRKHGLAVEAVMRHFARKHGEDEAMWGITGLLHDFDYEAHPNEQQHPSEGAVVLRERGYPEEVVIAILGHADYTGVPRDTMMAKTLYAVDELTGFVTAVALVRPSKSVMDVEPRSVRKKLKDKAFARAVNRDEITQGAGELAVELNEHIGEVIAAMRGVADELGLGGS
ncbi:MAG: HDIG domain-containing protein [Chloroflexi bacterium]|nr:HDIG domain-containing protein [Chloroflexota bacterium]